MTNDANLWGHLRVDHNRFLMDLKLPFVIVFLAVVWIRVSKRYPDDNRRLRQTIRTKADDYFNFFKIRTSWLAPTKATFDDMDDEQSKIGKKMNDDIEHKDIDDDDELSYL